MRIRFQRLLLIASFLVCLFGAARLTAATLPSGEDKNPDPGLSAEDLADRNEKAKNAILRHNKNVEVPDPVPVPTPPSGTPSPAPTAEPDPGHPSAPPAAELPLPSPGPAELPEILPGGGLVAAGEDPRGPGEAGGPRREDAEPLSGASPAAARDNASPRPDRTDAMETSGAQEDLGSLPERDGTGERHGLKPPALSGAAQDPMPERAGETSEVPASSAAARTLREKLLDPSRIAELRDRWIEGVVIYNNALGDLSAMMAGEVCILSDNTFYYVRFGEEESPRLGPRTKISAFLTRPTSLEGQVLWQGKIDKVIAS